MPDEYVEIFEQERDTYINTMDGVLDNVANAVATAKQQIQDGRQQISDYITSLPEDLQEIGQECAGEVQEKFDTLEQQVDDKQQQLVDDLAQRYSDSLAEVDAVIEQAKQESEGFLAEAFDAIAGPLATILEMKDMLLGVLDRAAGAIMSILADPIGFVGNLIDAVGLGFKNFLGNIGTHLQTGLISWLTGALGGAGITLPDTWDLQSIFQLVMQVLGVGFDQIMGKVGNVLGFDVMDFVDPAMQIVGVYQEDGIEGLMKYGLGQFIGEEGVASLMEVIDIVKMVMAGDWGQLWEIIQEHLNGLKEMVMGQIQEMIASEVIEAGVKWVLSLFNPAGAFVKACIMIYDVVQFFMERGSQIMSLVNAVIDSVAGIAAGDIGGAAAAIEDALATSIPVAISFLGSLLGLGNIPDRVQGIIESIRTTVDGAIDAIMQSAPVQAVAGFIKGAIDK